MLDLLLGFSVGFFRLWDVSRSSELFIEFLKDCLLDTLIDGAFFNDLLALP